MKKILFPTDFSPASHNAFIYALQFAKHLNAEVVTLHVYEIPIIDYVDVPAYQMEIYETVELSTFEKYQSHIPTLRRIADDNGCSDVQISNVLMDGDLVNTILQLVKEQGIEYVVMGTKGASGAVETFVGTSTANVMTRTNAFVLAVPEDMKYEPIRNIVFATRFAESDFTALQKLLKLASAFHAGIDVLHVENANVKVKDVVIADWKLVLANENITFHTTENESVEEGILWFLESHEANIIALLNREHGFFESLFRTSLTKKLAFHSKVPVLAIHED
ncbi:MAG: universal stress protein [Flavobacterium sp.]|uniref:universal stress protein n=1 Tax=Flavobacterium sp. TaxID=239 RepID=UPI0011F93413|nr:universal stress protein [Flavobacterium sp.]RZJ66146.1 MAG: universal stress protein [Flavobacterium sp.]